MNTATATADIDPDLLQPPALGAYWPGQGGIYCGTLPAMHGLPARHLIFGATDAPERLTWGEYGIQVPSAGSRLDGRANTAALLAHKATHGSSFPAAEWAAAYTADSHTDFHLPSQADLFMASLACPQLFNQSSWYWSSTQGGRSYAFVQGFEGGGSYWASRTSTSSRALSAGFLRPFEPSPLQRRSRSEIFS